MIFGTSKRLNKLDDQQLQIKHHQSTINNTSTYRYLGLTLNKTLNMSEHVQKTIKKASSRINLLKKMRCHLDSKTASLIYNTMIVPILTNSALATYGTTSASLDSKIYALERRARKVVGILASIPSSKQIKMKRVVAFIHRCINGKTIKNFENYFEVLESKINTRNNGKMTRIPKVKLEAARSSFYFQGALAFNNLPRELRTESSPSKFKILLDKL